MSATIRCTGTLVDLSTVESILNAREDVVESVAFGVPDNFLGEALQVYIVLADEVSPGHDLRRELQKAIRAELGTVEPRSVRFVTAIPHLRSGEPARSVVSASVTGTDVDTSDVVDPDTIAELVRAS